MKIVFLGKYNQSEILTGPEKVAKRIFREVSKNIPSCLFVEYFFKREGKSNLWLRLFGREIVAEDGSVIRLGIVRLFFFLISQQPDVIHVITFERFTTPLFLYKCLLRSIVIVTIHGVVKHEKKIFPVKETALSKWKDFLLEILMVKYSDDLIFVSDIELSLARRYYALDKTNVHVIPNGIDEKFTESAEKSFPVATLNVVMYERNEFARSTTDKLIRILLHCNQPGLAVFIIGGRKGDSVSNGGLSATYVGTMNGEELAHFFYDKHVYINAAAYDTFSLMAVESMASGVVPIVADTIGMNSYIKDANNGFVFSAERPEAIREIVEGIGSGKYEFRTLSHNARKIYDELKWSNVAQAYEDLYFR